MTDDEARALGERWIKAGGGWRPGMRFLIEEDVGGVVLPGGWYEDDRVCDNYGPHFGPPPADAVPDLRDPATRGAALDVVRERLGAPGAYVAPVRALGHADAIVLSGPRKGRKVGPSGWAVYGLGFDVLPVGASEAEAIVAALEAVRP